VIGFHFFNPVHRMPLVEIITTPATSKETIVTTLQFAKQLGKIPIVVKDSCGFIVNRILLGYINEAGRILQECGQMERVDKLITDFGLPMGPFTLSDEVGLDVGVKVLRVLEDHFGERFKPVDGFDKTFNKGYFGKKTGKGFYIYGQTKEPNLEIKLLLGRTKFKPFNGDEYLKRMIYIMINEAARCLEEGVVSEPGAIDVGMIFGTGFPPFRGGLLRYADHIGVDRVAGDLEWFASELKDERYRPCSYLARLRDAKKGFYSA
jgi:3-hydroxyacyl-CoA dehydrogenase/enoyl-CoA hydratase/3-hydroxybutyryl-CoA epimerase